MRTMRKKKRQLRLLPLLLAIGLFFSISAIALGSNNLNGNIEYKLITVEKNDTLWSLVEKHHPDYEGKKQNAIYQIRKLNHLENATLYVGQELKIPVELR